MYPFRYSGDFSKFLIDLEIVITTNLKRGQVGMKKYKLTDNISFLASVMRQASKASFVFVLLRIPLEVIIPYIGIWFSNLIVRASEESVNRTQLFTQAAVLGGLLVVLSLVNQYGKGIVSAESAYVRMKLTDMLNDHLMDCNYDMLVKNGRNSVRKIILANC